MLTHRSSGIVNFATGAMALVAAYTYAFLRRGELLVLFPGLPETVGLGGDLGLLPALLGAVAITAALGVVLHVLVFHPLRAAPPLAKAVASIGVGVVLTSVVFQRLGTAAVTVRPIFPTGTWDVGEVRVAADRVWFAATVLALTGALAAVYRWTRFGLQTRAAALSERGAYVSGISPDRISVVNGAVSAAVAGLAGILISPQVPLVPVAYALFIVPALAAATVGGFQHLVPAVVAGLLLGMAHSETAYLHASYDWLPAGGLAELVTLLVILVVLVVRGRPLPRRGAVVLDRLARAPRPRDTAQVAAVATAAAGALVVVLDGRWRNGLVTSLILAIVGLSLVVVTGYAGQVSLAQLTLAGVAGFLVGPLAESWGLFFPLGPLVAAGCATALGVVVGLPALRIRGLPVAVVTLALAVTLQAVWFRNLDLVPVGGVDVDPPELFGLDLGPGSGGEYPRAAFAGLVLVVLVACALGVARLRTSRLGASMLAVRSNERSAAATGIDVVRTKLVAFGLGAFLAGLGGSLLAYQQGNVTYVSFDAYAGLALVCAAYLAGITSISGGILAGFLGVGGLVQVATAEWLELPQDWYRVLAALGLVVTVVLKPEGVVGPVHEHLAARRSRRRRPPARGVGERVTLEKGRGPSLQVEHLGVRYGAVVAVSDISIVVPGGSIVGLIGPNGAGKSTVIDAVTGFTRGTGAVRLGEVSLDGLPPHRRARAGLGRTFQGIELWDDLTVGENVEVVGRPGDREEVLALLGLTELADRPAGELSQGQRQLVSVARALVGRPAVVLLDEPAAGLDTNESAWLGERLRAVRDSGIGVLLVDHDIRLVLDVCDQVHVLDLGRLLASGTPEEIRANRAVADAYLGTAAEPGGEQ